MEPQQQQNQQTLNEDNGSNKFLCRQTSTRWTPTADQVRILKELYYNSGVRSPTAEQIQRISARLRQYGKIEGKNVFYWFQNHKARERQKKRFSAITASTTDHHHHNRNHHTGSIQRLPCNNNVINAVRKNEQELSIHTGSYSNINPGIYYAMSSASAGVVTSVNGKVGNFGSYGSVDMEKHFRGCSVSSSSTGFSGAINGRLSSTWVSIDHYHCSNPQNCFDHQRKLPLKEEEEEDEEEKEEESLEMRRTLPLFPINPAAAANHSYHSGKHRSDGDGNGVSYTSLELSLNSYTGISPD